MESIEFLTLISFVPLIIIYLSFLENPSSDKLLLKNLFDPFSFLIPNTLPPKNTIFLKLLLLLNDSIIPYLLFKYYIISFLSLSTKTLLTKPYPPPLFINVPFTISILLTYPAITCSFTIKIFLSLSYNLIPSSNMS